MSSEVTSGDDASVPGAVVFLSGDLMFASRVKSAAQNAGRAFHLAGNLPETDDRIDWVIVDLATRSGVVDGLVERCESVCPGAQLIAYGPHVQVERLNKARQSGIERVLTRGQFDQSLSTLFSR